MTQMSLPPGSVLADYTIIYGQNQRRKDKTMERNQLVKNIKAAAHQKQIKGLQQLIPSNLAKWQTAWMATKVRSRPSLQVRLPERSYPYQGRRPARRREDGMQAYFREEYRRKWWCEEMAPNQRQSLAGFAIDLIFICPYSQHSCNQERRPICHLSVGEERGRYGRTQRLGYLSIFNLVLQRNRFWIYSKIPLSATFFSHR